MESEDNAGSVQTLQFSLQPLDNTAASRITLILCPSWPQSCGSITAVPDVVHAVRSVQGNDHGPVIVVDRYGGSEAATFCALSTLLRQLEFESHVDVYEACRLSHLCRPGIWRAQENYFFLYQVGYKYIVHTESFVLDCICILLCILHCNILTQMDLVCQKLLLVTQCRDIGSCKAGIVARNWNILKIILFRHERYLHRLF